MKILLALFFIVSASLSYAAGGIGLDATRIIYNAEVKSVNIGVRNTDSTLNYLIQPSISATLDEPETVTPFVSSPSLFKLQSGNEGVIKIMVLNQDKLPKDRESLFWFNVKAIPSSEKSGDLSEINNLKGEVKIAIGNTIKLIYRPKNLPGTPKEGASGLKFEKTKEGKLKVENNSPYYVNIQSLFFGGKHMKSTNMMMVPPYGDLVFEGITPPSNLKDIQWDVINDNGGTEHYES
ncbi:molecular chaperone [Hafnia alvei]|uniref:fimbrial biogenesis chaperone n=1 Tax=Hafnia alvei TaxID=569 RepID=UPI0014126273|nr:molecular chaperone [Hafnia alvei]QIP58247.1 molecular chaperone [Hafnia alvei]